MKLTKLFVPLTFLLFCAHAAAKSQSESEHVIFEVSGKGRPVLLIPGFLNDQRVWDATAKQLSKNYQVHRVSIKGFGRTPAAKTAPSLKAVKQQIIDYVNHNQLASPTIIGHSLGGFMGYWLASSEQVKLGGVVAVDGLPFIGILFSRDPKVSVDSIKPQAEYMKSFYTNASKASMEQSAQRGINIQATKESDKQEIVKMAGLSDPATAADGMYTLMTTDLRKAIAKTQTPILLLGASGGFTDPSSKKQLEALYNAQFAPNPLIEVKMNTESRHFIMFDQPEWLAAQIKAFLQETK